MITTLTIIFFVLGVAIGSFLNVVIFRYKTHRAFRGRSGCMTCTHQLSWHELIPIFSFLWLRGRCKNCQSKISVQYPIVEFTTGLVFAFLFLKLEDLFFVNTINFTITYAFYATIFALFLVVAVYDLKHKIIPDALVLILGILTFLGTFLFYNFYFYPHWPGIWDLLSGIIIALPFALMWFLSRGTWMGFGDAKLALSIGWLLGISLALSAMVYAFWLGAIVGVILIIFSKKHGMKSEIPFAPFLVAGTILSFFLQFYLFPFNF